jgi:hypothetical protein
MAEFFELSADERLEALVQAANASGRPPHLLEKDVWVVWSLRQLFAAPYAPHLVFKGGTSLSKAYGVIQRFSEDVDLTYDIRAIAGDLVGDAGTPLPASKSQEKKWGREIRSRLADWVVTDVVPRLRQDLEQQGLPAAVRAEGDKVFIDYPPLASGTGYAPSAVMLEFGARSTGEPCERRSVHCDAAAHLRSVVFPEATPQVMRAERTFWEKATAIHGVDAGQHQDQGSGFDRATSAPPLDILDQRAAHSPNLYPLPDYSFFDTDAGAIDNPAPVLVGSKG